MFWRPMSGWVPGSIGLCVPTAAGAMSGCRAPLPPCRAPAPALAPPVSLDFVWSWTGFNGKTQCKRGLTWTASLGAVGTGGGEWGGLLRSGKRLCNFSGNPEEAEGGQRAAPGGCEAGKVVTSGAGEIVGLLSSFQLWQELGSTLIM